MANILIVDTYPSIGLLYREVLQEQGHRVLVALSGEEALRLALCEPIDIVVLDDRLPDFEADELLRKLKRVQPHILGVLSVSSTFGSPINADLWDAIFVKTNDFGVLESAVERLCHESSSTVSPPLKQHEEQEIAPRYSGAT